MYARLYQSSDAEALDRLLGSQHGVRLDRDRITVLDASSGPVGVLAWRPGGIVHELRVGNGLGQKRRADLLVASAIGDAVTRKFAMWEAIFVTDSDRVAAYVQGLGAVEESGKRIFTMGVRQ